MSLIQELEQLIARTGSYNDRDLLTRVLERLKKGTVYNEWGAVEERKITRR